MTTHPNAIEKPADDSTWELWCLAIFKKIYNCPTLQRYKGRGHDQHGIDLLGTDARGKSIGVQCKLRSTEQELTVAEADADLERFLDFGKPLRAFSIACTHRSKDLQDWAKGKCKRGLDVKFYAWGDIEDFLRSNTALREELTGYTSRNDPACELAYCTALIDALDKMQLYAMESAQADVREPRLTTAHVSLDLSDVQSADNSRARIQGSLTVDQVMDGLTTQLTQFDALRDVGADVSDHSARQGKSEGRPSQRGNLLLLVGEAGRGKTTLLKYIAVRAAESRKGALEAGGKAVRASGADRILSWRDRVPFFREVRRAADARPIDSVAHLACEITPALSASIDDDWSRRVLAAKRALVLLDGVDEVPDGQPRIRLIEAIKKLVQHNPEALFVVSARPAAASDLRRELAPLGLREAHVQPLAGPKLREFMTSWHSAVSEAARTLNTGDYLTKRLAKIDQSAKDLPDKLDDSPHIKALMATPLLAALVCAYHLEHEYLPKNRSDLLDALVKSLIHNHDVQKPGMPEWPAYSELDNEDKISLLGSIAAEMVKNLTPTIPFDPSTKAGTAAFDRHIHTVLEKVHTENKSNLKGLRMGLKDRSGVLREVKQGQLDFVHNEFRDFLAARFIMLNERPAAAYKLVARALRDADWHSLVYFAITSKNKPRSSPVPDQLVKKLLAEIEKEPKDLLAKPTLSKSEHSKVKRYRALRRLAFRLGGASPPVSTKLYDALQKLRKAMLPPTTFEDAEIVNELGNTAVPQLVYNAKLGATRRAACVRALRLIDLPAARTALQGYADQETDWEVISELSEAVAAADIRHVCAVVSGPAEAVRLPGRVHGNLLRHAAGLGTHTRRDAAMRLVCQLPKLTIDTDDVALGLVSRSLPDNLSFAATNVRCFSSGFTDTGLEALVANGQAFAALALLNLSFTSVTDAGVRALVRGGRGLAGLTQLDLSRTKVTDTGIRELASSTTGLEGLASLILWSTAVTDVGVKELVREHTGLKRLSSLDLSRTQVTDAGLKALASAETGLKELTQLTLWDARVTDAGVRELTRAGTGLKGLKSLSLSGSRITDSAVKELSREDTGLKSLTELVLWESQVTDAGLKELAREGTGLKGLTSLSLWGVRVTDAGVKELARKGTGLRGLVSLGLWSTPVTDAGVKELAREGTSLDGLRSLSLAGTHVTDAGIRELACEATGLKGLTQLDVSRTKVTDTGVKAALDRWPGIKVNR